MPQTNPYSNVPVAPADLDLELLAGGREIELDIGFGRGQFILDRAAARPEALLIGLEMRRKWVGLVQARARRRELENVTVWYGDARHLLKEWGPDGAISSIFVNFPDPWWKKRHQKRRVVTPESVREFARLLAPGGHLLVQTDVMDRGDLYRRTLEGESTLEEAVGSADEPLEENPIGTLSHREKKCAASGLPVCRFYFRRISESGSIQPRAT